MQDNKTAYATITVSRYNWAIKHDYQELTKINSSNN